MNISTNIKTSLHFRRERDKYTHVYIVHTQYLVLTPGTNTGEHNKTQGEYVRTRFFGSIVASANYGMPPRRLYIPIYYEQYMKVPVGT